MVQGKPKQNPFDLHPTKLKLVSLERAFDNPIADIRRVTKSLEILGPHERKFIVLVGKDNMYVVVGMKFVDERKNDDFYMHREMVDAAKHILDKKDNGAYVLSGGGKLEFVRGYGEDKPWQATVGDASSDFGVWDYRVLDHRQAIADALDMQVYFSWRGCEYPTSMRKRVGL